MKNESGILVQILRQSGGDCTNRGVSSRFDHFIVIGEGIPEVTEAHDNLQVLILVKRFIGGKLYKHLEPLQNDNKKIWFMFGGNFAYSTDSRFREYVNDYPLPIHDRRE